MRDFALLDGELARMDEKLSWNSVASTSTLPSISKFSPPLQMIPLLPDASSPIPKTLSIEESRLANLLQSLNPPRLATEVDSQTPEPTVEAKESPDALWWQTVASTSSSIALSSGIPSCPFSASRPRTKGIAPNGMKAKAKRRKQKEVPMEGLEIKMEDNMATLQKIRRLHIRIAHGKLSDNNALVCNVYLIESIQLYLIKYFYHVQDLHPAELTESDESDLENTNRKKQKDKHVATSVIRRGVRLEALQSLQADGVARESMNRVSNTALRHAGFEGEPPLLSIIEFKAECTCCLIHRL